MTEGKKPVLSGVKIKKSRNMYSSVRGRWNDKHTTLHTHTHILKNQPIKRHKRNREKYLGQQQQQKKT